MTPDLVRAADVLDISTAFNEVAAAGRHDLGDELTFQVSRPKAANPSQLLVDVYVSGLAQKFDEFPIDLSSRPGQVSPVEYHAPTPILAGLGLSPLPQFARYPIANQIADKLCAMYELHGDDEVASTRYHDLVDLVVITTSRQIDGTATSLAIALEENRRDRLNLSNRLMIPSPSWATGYAKVAVTSHLDHEFRTIEAAMALLARFAEPVLAQAVFGKVWDPTTRTWLFEPR